ncbi:hypothetical protein AHiyo6_00750 [Arthrobacter sp. Hiyo6]|nr:hypothetical protein AHiyo6_00750 [Arthrobacter sp. Hiyo6]
MGQLDNDGDPLALLFDELAPAPRGTATPTHRWRDLDPSTVRTAWLELDRWVRWFVSTYRLSSSVVPDCWWRHSELVAELYALQRAELVSFGEADSGFGPLGFHERIPLAVERCGPTPKRLVVSGCRPTGSSDHGRCLSPVLSFSLGLPSRTKYALCRQIMSPAPARRMDRCPALAGADTD